MDIATLVQRLAERLQAGSAEPVSRLLIDELWLAVVDGSLDGGERLPTARELAIALNVRPRSIEHAYAELERRGVVATRPGSGTFVSLAEVSEAERERQRKLADLCRETVRQTRALGFELEDLLDALAEYRSERRQSQQEEAEPW